MKSLRERIEKLKCFPMWVGNTDVSQTNKTVGDVLTELSKTTAEVGHILEHYSYLRTQVLKALSNEEEKGG